MKKIIFIIISIIILLAVLAALGVGIFMGYGPFHSARNILTSSYNLSAALRLKIKMYAFSVHPLFTVTLRRSSRLRNISQGVSVAHAQKRQSAVRRLLTTVLSRMSAE